MKKRMMKPVYDEASDAKAKADADAKAKAEGETVFTQEQVNQIIAKERAADKEAKARLVQQLEEAKSKVNMTSQEKETYETQLEELRKLTMTKDELAARERKKLEDKLSKEKDEAITSAKGWKNRFEESTIRRSLMDSAVANEAYAPQQLVALLASNSRVVELSDEEGKPTGNFDVLVKFNDVDTKTSKPIVLELSASEVVKRMKEIPETYGNLFKNGVSTGIGSSNGKGGKALDTSKMTPTEYKANRAQLKAEGKI